MELTNLLLRPRFCIRYFQILLTFLIFSVFIIFFHQYRPKDFAYVRGNINFMRGRSTEDSTTGVSPIIFSHIFNKKDENCKEDSESSSMLEGILPELPVGRARYDNRRLLKIYDFFRTASVVEQYDVCLATQSSLERIYWLPHILRNWNGPLSISVFVTNEEEWLILNLFIKFMERCDKNFRKVSLHLVIPSSISPFCLNQDKLKEWNKTINFDALKSPKCGEPREYMRYLLHAFPVMDKEKLALKEVYPQNHMRNIARKACHSQFTFSSDVDIIPRNGMAEALQAFFESLQIDALPCKKCAFVIPTFELDEKQRFPESKAEIVKNYNEGSARQFHGKIFDVGHKATNYGLWAITTEDGPIKISHPIDMSNRYLYEPFYVSDDSIPPYDERFLGYGFTRNSQFQEALYAGWNFYVLTPVFSIHWGLQSHRTLLSPKKGGVGNNVRIQQTSANRLLFNKILKEMKLRKHEGLF